MFWAQSAGRSATLPRFGQTRKLRPAPRRQRVNSVVSSAYLLFIQQYLERTDYHYKYRKRQQPPRFRTYHDRILQFPQQAAKGRQGLGHTQPQGTQIGFSNDENRNRNPELRQQRAAQVGHKMQPYQLQTRKAGSASHPYKL